MWVLIKRGIWKLSYRNPRHEYLSVPPVNPKVLADITQTCPGYPHSDYNIHQLWINRLSWYI